MFNTLIALCILFIQIVYVTLPYFGCYIYIFKVINYIKVNTAHTNKNNILRVYQEYVNAIKINKKLIIQLLVHTNTTTCYIITKEFKKELNIDHNLMVHI